jgi:hypothetical protein
VPFLTGAAIAERFSFFGMECVLFSGKMTIFGEKIFLFMREGTPFSDGTTVEHAFLG